MLYLTGYSFQKFSRRILLLYIPCFLKYLVFLKIFRRYFYFYKYHLSLLLFFIFVVYNKHKINGKVQVAYSAHNTRRVKLRSELIVLWGFDAATRQKLSRKGVRFHHVYTSYSYLFFK